VSEPALTAREPFAGLAGADGPTMLREGLALRCVSDRACISVAARRGRTSELLAAGRSAFGVEIPARPRLASAASVSFLWAGRSIWMALAAAQSPTNLEERLRAAFGETASLVDQSDSRSSLHVCGAQTRTFLSRLIPIDLHPRAFLVGDTALTLIGAVNGQVTLIDAAPTFELTVTRAFAASFWESLQEAALGLS
jgi:heterotetrameric sarcosine oxidase gamma subunit